MGQRTTLSLEFVERQRNRLEALRDQLRGEEEQAVAAQQSFQRAYGSAAAALFLSADSQVSDCCFLFQRVRGNSGRQRGAGSGGCLFGYCLKPNTNPLKGMPSGT
jgi:hypothetical protein